LIKPGFRIRFHDSYQNEATIIKRQKIFFGWWIVGLGVLAQFIGIGVSSYSTSIFFQAMFTDLNWSRGDLALAISAGSILAAIASPFAGAIVDKHGAGRIMVIGAFLSGVCLILLGSVHELWQAFIIFSLLALFRVGFVSIPVTTMVSNWFVKKRGRALGIMTAGQGLGGLILSPLTVFLISRLGWRMSWAGMGILTWIAIIPAALVLARPRPETIGLTADGLLPAGRSQEASTEDNIKAQLYIEKYAMKTILRMPLFWLIALLYPVYLFGHLSFFQHGYALFIDEGLPATTAGTLMSILGLFSLSGKIVLGYLSDKISVRTVMMLALGMAAISILFLILAEPTWGAWTFIIFWGFWECGVIALQPVLVASSFNRDIIGKMLGIFTVFTVLPQLIGPAFMGYIFDVTGSYNLALFVIMGLYMVSMTMVFFTRIPQKRSLS
jgi:MFS transporter, OFA family, oxalate/formate antiporter